MAAILALGAGSLVLTNTNQLMTQNLVAASVARGHAEAGVDAVIVAMAAAYRSTGSLPTSVDAIPGALLAEGAMDYAFASPPAWNGDTVTIRVVGRGPRNAEYVAEALVSFSGGVQSGASPFTGAVIGCEGALVSNSGTIDSFDSRMGSYHASTAGRAGSVQTVEPGALVQLTGNSPVFGDVLSTGGVITTGSSRVLGEIRASGDVTIGANAVYEGGIRTTGTVRLNNTATFHGDVSSNESVVFANGAKVHGSVFAGTGVAFNNTGARVHGSVQTGGNVTRGHSNASVVHVDGTTTTGAAPVPNLPVAPVVCDPIDVVAMAAAYAGLPASGALSTGWPRNRWEITPSGIRYYDETWNVRNWVNDASRVAHSVEMFGRPVTMIKTNDINLGNGELRITGGDVVVFVDGNLTLGTGGGAGLVIDPDSSLTVIVTGRTRIGSSVQMAGRSPVNANGTPAFTLYSTMDQANANSWDPKGVSIEGNSRLTAAIYAPLTNVSVNAGGGMFGSVRGRRVEVTGGAGFHYDEALGAVAGGAPGGSTAAEGMRVLARR
jgi:predicted acyltransferase (DUF342 family)